MRRGFSFAVIGALGFTLNTIPAFADTIRPPEDIGSLVGMAWDDQSDILWMAGSQANSGKFIGIRADGSKAVMTVDENFESVQALAYQNGKLYIADIGDRSRSREYAKLFVVSRPAPGKRSATRYELHYPGNRAQDAEALMVSPKGNIYLVTKGNKPSVYRAMSDLSDRRANRLRRVADAPEDISDGVFLRSDKVALRGSDKLLVVDAFKWKAEATETYVGSLPAESLALRGQEILVGSDKGIRSQSVPTSNITSTPAPLPDPVSPSPAVEPKPSPTTQAPSSTPSPSPTEEPTASQPATAQPTAENSADGQAVEISPNNHRTQIALIVAAAISVLAAVVTFAIRK